MIAFCLLTLILGFAFLLSLCFIRSFPLSPRSPVFRVALHDEYSDAAQRYYIQEGVQPDPLLVAGLCLHGVVYWSFRSGYYAGVSWK